MDPSISKVKAVSGTSCFLIHLVFDLRGAADVIWKPSFGYYLKEIMPRSYQVKNSCWVGINQKYQQTMCTH